LQTWKVVSSWTNNPAIQSKKKQGYVTTMWPLCGIDWNSMFRFTMFRMWAWNPASLRLLLHAHSTEASSRWSAESETNETHGKEKSKQKHVLNTCWTQQNHSESANINKIFQWD
jgi:hypothetical protein